MRFYDPAAGRFVSRDPLGTWGDPEQRGNAQNYCGNNPVNSVDPLGLDDIKGTKRGDIDMVTPYADDLKSEGLPSKWLFDLIKTDDTEVFQEPYAKYLFNKKQCLAAYDPWKNNLYYEIHLFSKKGKLLTSKEILKAHPKTAYADIAGILQELFHAWYDQIGEEKGWKITDEEATSTYFDTLIRGYLEVKAGVAAGTYTKESTAYEAWKRVVDNATLNISAADRAEFKKRIGDFEKVPKFVTDSVQGKKNVAAKEVEDEKRKKLIEQNTKKWQEQKQKNKNKK